MSCNVDTSRELLPMSLNMVEYIRKHRLWSAATFGPGARTKGLIAHIRKELVEIEADPRALEEWVDVIILAIDGAWRSGHSSADIVQTMVDKQIVNSERSWPDWRKRSQDEPIEHVKTYWQPLDCSPDWTHVFPAFGSGLWADSVRGESRFFPSVVFVGSEKNGVFTPTGAGLLAGVQDRVVACPFLVTAQHVVDSIPGEFFAIRLNRVVGDCTTIRIPKTPNLAALRGERDVGIFPLNISPEIFEHSLTRLDRREWNGSIAAIGRPSVGDDVSSVCLYTTHDETTVDRPSVRLGSIAAMPDEGDGYLIEAKSLVGFGGSPVYLGTSEGRLCILGIMTRDRRAEPLTNLFAPATSDELNIRFGVVVPIERVFDILESDEVKAIIKDTVDDFFKKSGFRQSSSSA